MLLTVLMEPIQKARLYLNSSSSRSQQATVSVNHQTEQVTSHSKTYNWKFHFSNDDGEMKRRKAYNRN